MSTITDLTQGNFRIGLEPARPDAHPDEWKRLIGQNLVAARLNTLEQEKVRWSALAASTSLQIVLAAILIVLPIFFPERLVTHLTYEVTPLEAPVTEVPVGPNRPVAAEKPQPVPAPDPLPQRVATRTAPLLIPPRPKPIPVQNQEVPKFEQVLAETKFEARPEEPIRPREPVQTGVLNTSTVASVAASQRLTDVQTGGFGDPHGFIGEPAPGARGNVARVGSFDLPAGSGLGNGTGGANGVRGAVASTGFGHGVVVAAAANGKGTSGGAMVGNNFATAQVDPNSVKAKPQAPQAAAVRPVVLLAKPNPVYTEEARKLGIEGEVLVDVIFRASGQVQTVRLVKGLGHGLDEAAIRAAEQIRFQPALQEGQAVDFPATVHIVFQLAF